VSRFNYVKYDQESVQKQEEAKKICENLETLIESLGAGRPQALALTALEEAYMWIGKAVRDNQVKRGSQIEHVAERSAE